MEKTVARIMREAGGRVRENFYLRNAGISAIDPADGRHIEVVVSGLPLARGIPLAIDATLVSTLDMRGRPHRQADARPNVCLRRAEHNKERTYPELVGSSRLRLWTVALELGGRFSVASRALLEQAAHARARTEPVTLRSAAAQRWYSRWTTMLSISVQDALAATLVADGAALLDGANGQAPLSVDLWAQRH